MAPIRAASIWAALAAAVGWPLAVAATSPLLAWREPVYIAAGLAGVVALALLLVQPLLATGRLPGMTLPAARRVHRGVGVALLVAVVVHVGGLWITSPPDVVDALSFASPTPFSAWGVVAMWAAFAAAALAGLRRRLRLTPRFWRRAHTGLAAVLTAGGAVHAVLVVGTMGTPSKIVLCALALAAAATAVAGAWGWRRPSGRAGPAIRDVGG